MWSSREQKILHRCDSPERIQKFLNAIEYHYLESGRSPKTVIKDRQASCVDGALFAIAAFELHNIDAKLLLLDAVQDDRHAVAIYRKDGYYGTVGKSSIPALEYRPPRYPSLRDLVMSFTNNYYNKKGQLTLMGYGKPQNPDRIDNTWRANDKAVRIIANADVPTIALNWPSLPRLPVLPKRYREF
jgi:hypothetical protein